MNPAHEARTRALILEEFPGVHVSLSSEVLPRIREWAAALDHAGERLSRARDGALYRPSQCRARPHRRAHAAALPDAVERRRHAVHGGDRRRQDRAHAVVRAGRRRPGERLSGRRGRGSRHPRHGRHQRRHRLHRRRSAAGGDRRRDQPPPDRRAGARHDDDLGRRRLDRGDRWRRLSHGRAAERRRRSRPRLLRARRDAPDRDRRGHRVRLPQSRIIFSAARSGSTSRPPRRR